MATKSLPRKIAASVGGLDAVSALMDMSPKSALILDNFIPYPDALEMRPGYTQSVTGFVSPLQKLWTYASAAGVESLWGTSDTGIYNCSTPGAAPALSLALTNGVTAGTSITTGANSYLMLVNGTDSLSQYDGATWTAVAVFGAVNTNTYSAIATYNQRLFMARKNSLTIEYLAINSISGAPTAYELGAIFNKGGKIVAIGTWTLDGGLGSNDKFVVMTSMGEVAVFSGSDPSVAASWIKEGVYLIGKPIGNASCMQKFGSDLLLITESGVIPMSKVVLSQDIQATISVTDSIRPLVTALAKDYGSVQGWELLFNPSIPLLVLNVPKLPESGQFCFYTPTKSWCTFSGWNAKAFGMLNGAMYWTDGANVNLVGGFSDLGANIVATSLSAYQECGSNRPKRAVMVKTFLQPQSGFSVGTALARDFNVKPNAGLFPPGALTGQYLWNTALWNASYWSDADAVSQNWLAIEDTGSQWKANFVQVASKSVRARYLGSEFRFVYSNGMGY